MIHTLDDCVRAISRLLRFIFLTHGFDVRLRDRFDNPCIRANVRVQLWHKERALDTPFAVVDGVVKNETSSVVKVEYKALISGSYDLRVSLISGIEDVHTASQVVTGSWLPLEIFPARVTESSTTTLQGLPDEVVVNTSYPLIITSRDRFGNVRFDDEVGDWYGVIFDGVTAQRQEVQYAGSDGTYTIQLVPEIPSPSQPNEETYDYLLRVYLGQNRGLRARYYQSVDVENLDESNRGGGVVSVDYEKTWGTKGYASGVWSYMTWDHENTAREGSAGWLGSDIVHRVEFNRSLEEASVIRFEGFFLAPTSELYTFTVHGLDDSNDRVDIVLNDDTWIVQNMVRTGTINLQRSGMYFLRIEWQNVDENGEVVSVRWHTHTRPESVVLGSENRFVADVSDINGSPFSIDLVPM